MQTCTYITTPTIHIHIRYSLQASPIELCPPGFWQPGWDWSNPYINRCTTHNDYQGLNIPIGESLRKLAHQVSRRGCNNMKSVHLRHYYDMCSSSLAMICHSRHREFNLVSLIIYGIVESHNIEDMQ